MLAELAAAVREQRVAYPQLPRLPTGASGEDLAARAYTQAWYFGAKYVSALAVTGHSGLCWVSIAVRGCAEAAVLGLRPDLVELGPLDGARAEAVGGER
jgi:hypothetical protein